MTLTPVDYDPFAATPAQGGPKLTPVDYDPFAQSQGGVKLTPVDYDPFAKESTLTKAVKFVTGGKDEVDPSTGQPRLTATRLGVGSVESMGEGAKNVVPGLRASKVLDEAFFRDSPDDNLVQWHQSGGNPAAHVVDRYVANGMPYAQAIRQAGIEQSRAMQQSYRGTEQALEQKFPKDPAFDGKTSGNIESGILGVAGSLPGMAATAVNPVAGVGILAAQQAGQTFKEHEQAGADPERAAKGAWASALLQAPVEYLGNLVQLRALGRAFGKSPMGLRVLDLAKSGVAEGLENVVQGVPEDVANIWIKNPDKTLGEAVTMAAQDPEKFKRSYDRAVQGVIGGVALTGTGQAVGAGVRKITGDGKQQQPAPTGAESLHAVGDSQDAATAAKIIGPESGGDPNAKNPNSTARGMGQFIQSTRDDILKRHGVDATSADPAEQQKATEILVGENRAALTKSLGRAPSDGEIYTAHFLGPTGATDFLRALEATPDDPAVSHVRPAQANANPTIFLNKDGSTRTVAEVAALLAGKVDQGAQPAPIQPNTRPAPQEAPQGEFGPLRPELAALREDMQSQPGVEQEQGFTPTSADPWRTMSVQDAARESAGVPLHRGRENELTSLRNDILGRETQARVVEEQGATLPVREADRLEQTPALPAGQGFEMVGKPQGLDTMLWKDLRVLGKEMGIDPQKMTRVDLQRAIQVERSRKGIVDPSEAPGAGAQAWLTDQIANARNEAADPVTSAVWGRIDKASVDAPTGKALMDKFGPGIFARKGKGASWDQLTGELHSLGVQLPETHGGQPLLDYLIDRGISKKQSVARSVGEARAEAGRMGTAMAGEEFSNRRQFRPEDNYERQAAQGHIDEVPFSAQGKGGSLRTQDISRATDNLRTALPRAAETRIVQAATELPAHIQEAARRQGHSLSQVEGVFDHRSNSVVLVADNMSSPKRAAEVWLHEQVAHHGLRELFRNDAKFSQLLEYVRKDYGLDDHRAAEEQIARLAEKLNAGETLKGKDGFHWRKIVDYVRSWLVEKGFSTSKENVEALLRKSLRNLAKGGEERGQEHGRMQEVEAFSQKGEGGLGSILPEVASSWGGKAGEIRLLDGNDKAGAIHIEKDHGRQIRSLGYSSVKEFVADVTNNFDAVFQGQGRSVYLVTREGSPWRSAMVKMEYHPKGDFYSVTTAMPIRPDFFFGKDGGQKKGLLWERAQSNRPAGETGTPSAVSGQRSLSGDKITTPGPNGKPDTHFSIKREAEDLLPKLAQSTDMGVISRILRSPEYQKHPVIKKLVSIFSARHDRAHEIINTVLDAGDGSMVLEKYKALGEANKKLLDHITIIADERKIRPEAVEQWMEKERIPEEVREVWRHMRKGYDTMLDEMLKPSVEELEKGNNPDITYVDSSGKTVTMSLRDAVNEMRSLKGFYAPRIRPIGEYAVSARRTGADGEVEYARYHAEWQRQAKGIMTKLKGEGWEITKYERISRLPESAQQDVAKLRTAAHVISSAAQKLQGVSDEAKQSLFTQLVEDVATEIKSRGLRSSTIRRTGRHGRSVKGYEEDSGKRFADYVQRTAYGIAKRESAQNSVEALFQTGEDGKLLLDPGKDPRAFQYAQDYVREMLRNSEKADRLVGLAKAIATFKYLGFNPKSAALNLTTLVTQVPPALRVYATDSKAGLSKCSWYLARATDDAVKFMLGREAKNLTEGEALFLKEVRRKSLDDPQLSRELSRVNESTAGTAGTLAMREAMRMFGATEQFNRVITLLAAYRLARDAGHSHAESMERAQTTSDKAHGMYGRESMPEFTWGTGAGARAGQLMYVYQKYTHNTFQLLSEVWGKGDVRSFIHLLSAPIVLAGDKAGTAWFAYIAAKYLLKLCGDDDRDPHERLMAWIREVLGAKAEDLARFGLAGMLGVDISGSMGTRVNMPEQMWDISGGPGGVAKDLVGKNGAVHYLATGQYGKALEKALPTYPGQVLKSVRESVQGVTDTKGNRLIDEQGKAYMPTQGETAAKALGFRPSREARIRDMTGAARDEERNFQDRRASIYEEYRALNNSGKDPAAMRRIVDKVADFNADVDRMDRPNISPITRKSLESALVRMETPSKKELGRMGIGEADVVPTLTDKDFARAEERVTFKVEAKRVTAAKDAYDEAYKAGRKDEAARILSDTDLKRLYGPVKFYAAQLSGIERERGKLEDNPRMDAATRARRMDKLDQQEAVVLANFKKTRGRR